ncbi:hypothetical protein NDU88_010794 [Pleurodeles waltl]|uniref:Uncharacterized protein n=1 Tax=Pleurodeles waltl TaxID=8319 RepID=A0AAV7Q393_PLEWA|nr:hypothetical protein NDU88_010794 [Pleurodeles waltl]
MKTYSTESPSEMAATQRDLAQHDDPCIDWSAHAFATAYSHRSGASTFVTFKEPSWPPRQQYVRPTEGGVTPAQTPQRKPMGLRKLR